jgi:arsenate reductase
MAEGYTRHRYGDRIEVESAGAMPDSVNPNAIAVMREIDIDITDQRGKSVGEFAGQRFDYVITLCGDSAKDVCPAFVGDAGERLHWDFPDPIEARGSEEEILAEYRAVRDGIINKIDEFFGESQEVSKDE